MTAILSLGSNLGDRRGHLEAALQALSGSGLELKRVSPVVESPAMLPNDAPSEWNRPFLNLVAECTTGDSPQAMLATLKNIEQTLGRSTGPRWSPRPIDIDIVLYNDDELHTDTLTIPHAGLTEREFVLAPLAAIAPQRTIPGTGGQTILSAYRKLATAIPLWMGIVNVTPDSFSDGGRHQNWSAVESTLDRMLAADVAAIDFGAESTRPGAQALTADEEWNRLEPILERAIDKFSGRLLRPAISIDTYHADVAARAIRLGADTINDVSGLTDPAMLELATSAQINWIAMHQLSLPADPSQTLATGISAVDQVAQWLDAQLERWARAGLDLARITFDPGVGFGKTPLQSLDLLRGIERFVRDDMRVMVGHSRKSFMRPISAEGPSDRDLLTIGASLTLAERGVDVLRVHNVADHAAAFRGFAHARPS